LAEGKLYSLYQHKEITSGLVVFFTDDKTGVQARNLVEILLEIVILVVAEFAQSFLNVFALYLVLFEQFIRNEVVHDSNHLLLLQLVESILCWVQFLQELDMVVEDIVQLVVR